MKRCITELIFARTFRYFLSIFYMAIVPILWSLLNVTLLVGLLIGLSTAFGSLKKRFGFLGALLLVMMLVSRCRQPKQFDGHLNV